MPMMKDNNNTKLVYGRLDMSLSKILNTFNNFKHLYFSHLKEQQGHWYVDQYNKEMIT